MKRLAVVVIIVSLIFWSHCSTSDHESVNELVFEEEAAPVNVKFTLEKRIGLTNINYPSLFVTGEEIFVYGEAHQEKKEKLLIYNHDLVLLLTKKFFYGQGAGDVGGGAHFFKYGEHIYVPDNTQQRVNVFDKDFKFVKFIKMLSSLYPITFIKNGEYFICAKEAPPENNKRIFLVNLYSFPDFKKITLCKLGPFGNFDKKGRWILFGLDNFHYFYKNGRIYLINMKKYKINMYDISGKILRSIRVNVELQPVPEEMKEPWLKEILGRSYRRSKNKFNLADTIQPASFMIPLKNGFAVVRRNSYSMDCSGSAEGDYIDYDLTKLHGKIQIPCFHKIFQKSMGYIPRTFHYSDGYLYLIAIDYNEDHFLEKWRVTE